MIKTTRDSHKKYDYMSKIVIVGDAAVGKTNILLRFTQDHYRIVHNSTIGVDFKIKTMKVQDKKIKFTLWDTAGQDRFKTITTNYYRGTDAVIFAYSISDRNSFNNMQNWITNVQQNTQKDICKMIVANKCDLSQRQRQVSQQQGKLLAKRLNIPFFQVSAKQNILIDQIFNKLGLMIKMKIQGHQDNITNAKSKVFIKKNKYSIKNKTCC